jgi:hypothetical protein
VAALCFCPVDECQFDWIERHLGDLWSTPLCVSVRAFPKTVSSHEGSDIINGLIHWWFLTMNRLLGGGRPVEVGPSWRLEVGCWWGCMPLRSTYWPWPLPVTLSASWLPWDGEMMLCLTTTQTQQNQPTKDWNLWNHEPKWILP